MGVQSDLRRLMASNLTMFDAEEVTLGGLAFKGVLAESTASIDLFDGGTETTRELKAQFPARTFATMPRPGQRATARGRTWKITSVEDGLTAVTLTLGDVNHRDK
jgi:hypothetical protein